MGEEKIDPRKVLMLFENPSLSDFTFVEKAHEVSVVDILLFPDMFTYPFGVDVAKALILESIRGSKSPEEMQDNIIRGRKILEGLQKRFKKREDEGKLISPADVVTEISESLIE